MFKKKPKQTYILQVFPKIDPVANASQLFPFLLIREHQQIGISDFYPFFKEVNLSKNNINNKPFLIDLYTICFHRRFENDLLH